MRQMSSPLFVCAVVLCRVVSRSAQPQSLAGRAPAQRRRAKPTAERRRALPKARRSTATCSTIRPGNRRPSSPGSGRSSPTKGQPASENTEVRIDLHARHALHRRRLLRPRSRVDHRVRLAPRCRLDDTDSFRMIFDTYQRSAERLRLRHQSRGDRVRRPGDQRRPGRRRVAAATSSPDRAAASISTGTPPGKSARRSTSAAGAPSSRFRSGRCGFPSGADQVWGVNFQRNIRRRNERAYWAPIPRQYNLYRLSLAGTVAGIQTPTIRNFKVTPYVLGSVVASGERPVDSDVLGDVGGDVKYNLTPSLTLDGTINTDFAQVEVDDQQVNLDRFTLFFPEKRPFFLENAGFFSVGNPGESRLVLQPPDRHRRQRRGDSASSAAAACRARPARSTSACSTCRPTTSRTVSPATTSPSCASAATCPTGRRSAASSSIGRAPAISPRDDDHNRTYARRRQVGHRAEPPCSRASSPEPRRRASTRDDYAFNVRSRTNVPRYDLELGYQEVGDQLQSGGRLPQPARLSQAGRARADALPAEGLPQPAGGAAARVVPRLLGARRVPGDRLHPPRQPLAVPQLPTRSTPA